MLRIERVLGSRLEPALSAAIDRLEHRSSVDIVRIAIEDLARRRLLVTTLRGERLAIALPRHQKLFDGAVLLLDEARAIVVQASAQRWLQLTPRDAGDAIELGYLAGNLHWRVRFGDRILFVALNGPIEDYVARLKPLLESGRVIVTEADGDAAGLGAAGPDPSHVHHHHHHDHQGHDHGH